jgi:tRNA threonylcarbamoyladenosine biosynthesis protein TsaB
MLLALDTATATASVAVYDLTAQQLLAEFTWQAQRRHTQELLVVAQQLLTQLGLTAQDLTALAVTTGPGSFTGVRIAISAVKGIGLGLASVPRVIGLPTLSVTAAPWLALAVQTQPLPTICPYIRAGRGRYNWAFFAAGDLLWRPTAPDHSGGSAEEFALALAQSSSVVWLIGELDAALQQAIAGPGHIVAVDALSSGRRAGQLARLAALHFANGAQDDLRTLQPLYLRNP